MRSIIVLLIVLLCSCATGYQPKGFTGGFSESRLDEHVYRVSFEGNGFTSVQKASDMTMMRASELTVKAGYRYFGIISQNRYTNNYEWKQPSTTYVSGTATSQGNNQVNFNAKANTYGGQTHVISKPGESISIYMVNEKPSDVFVYDAVFVYEQMYNKYMK